MTSTLITAPPAPDVGHLLTALRTLDVVIAKAVKLSEVAQIRQTEQRMFEKLHATWVQLSKTAAKEAGALAAQGKNADACAAAINKVMGRWAPAVTPFFSDATKEIYRLARIAGWRKATKQTTATLSYDDPATAAVQKARKPITVEINPSFDVVDEAAAKALVKHQVFWIGEHYGKHVSDSVAKVAREVMVEAGQNRVTAGSLMREKAADQLSIVSIPAGYTGNAKSYFEGLTANAATVARTHGQMRSFIDVGITRYEIVAVGDERMCPVCGHMDGKVFTVGDAAGLMDKELKAKDPGQVKRIHPWSKLKGLTAVSGPGRKGHGAAALVSGGHHLPPFHFRCRCTVDVSEDAGSWDALKPGETPVGNVPAPEGVKVPGKPGALPLRTPTPLPTSSHPAEPTGKFNQAALAEAFKKGGPRKGWAVPQQQEIRRQLNALGKDLGLHNMDVALKLAGADKFGVHPGLRKMGAEGVHRWDGTIQSTGNAVSRAQEFLAGVVDFNTASGFKVFVHEMMHGHSPLGGSSAYQGKAIGLEEATTEIAARYAIDKKWNLQAKHGWRLMTRSTVYQKYIDKLYEALNVAAYAATKEAHTKKAVTALSAPETMDFAVEASLAFKRYNIPLNDENRMFIEFAYRAQDVIPARLLAGLDDAQQNQFRQTFRTTLTQQMRSR